MLNKRYFSYASDGDNTVIRWNEPCLIGDAVAEIAGLELRELIDSNCPSVLVMDFTDVKAISSSVIGCLIRVQIQVRHNGGRMRFAAVSASMVSLFRTMNLLGNRFEVVNTAEEAIESSPARLDLGMQMRIEECV